MDARDVLLPSLLIKSGTILPMLLPGDDEQMLKHTHYAYITTSANQNR